METPIRTSRIIAVVALIFAAGLLTACAVSQPRPEETKTPACRPLPESFREDDLIGTWVAEYEGGAAIDTLVIKKDGTYKQIYTSIAPGSNFESDWKKWWLEQRPSGYIRLHMEGMHKCDSLEGTCERPSGGMSPDDWAIDPCEGGLILMPNEVVLIAAGYPVPVPKGIVLRQTRVGGSEWDYGFELKE